MASVAKLKRQLRRHYLVWCRESEHLDCGLHLARNLNPRIAAAERKMSAIGEQLRDLGENVPKLPGETDC